MEEKVTYVEEFARVLIAVVDSDAATVDHHVGADAEVEGHQGSAGAVFFEHHLAFEEDALRSARIDLFGLVDQDRVVFQVVVNEQLADSVVFEAALNHGLFEIAEES